MTEGVTRVQGVVHVVAALDGQGNAVAERHKKLIGPWSKCDDGLSPRNRPLFGLDHPPIVGLRQATRVAHEDPSSLADEEIGIGLDQRARIRNRFRVMPMYTADRRVKQCGLQGPQRFPIEERIVEAVWPVLFGRPRRLVLGGFRAKGLDPPVSLYQAFRAGLDGQEIVLDNASFDQGTHGLDDGEQTRGLGVPPIAGKPGRQFDKMKGIVADGGRPVEAEAHHRGNLPGKGIRDDA